MAAVLHRESTALRARLGHVRRIRPPLQAAACNGDLRGAGNLYFRAALNRVEVQLWMEINTYAYVYAYNSLTDFYVIAMDDRVRGQTRGFSAALGVRYSFQ